MPLKYYAPVLEALLFPEKITHTYNGLSLAGLNVPKKLIANHILHTNIIYWN